MIAFDRRQPPPSIINTIKAAQIYSELRRYSLSLKTDRSKLTAAAVAAEAAGWKIFRLMKPRGRSRSQTLAGAVAAANSRPVLVICAAVFLVGAAVSVPWINNSLRSSITGSGATAVVKEAHNAMASAKNTSSEQIRSDEPLPPPQPPPSFSCPAENETDEGIICRDKPPSPPSVNDLSPPPPPSCPQYFRWIHEDLRPWRSTGITREMVERGRRTANFRLVVLGGRAYLERYRRSFQSRDVFTLWGIVQLLRRYPGRIPDLDLMFDTVDWPVINAADYRGRDAAPPPPLFRYCGDDSTLDIVFPDWSFWGWPEINIKPWEKVKNEIKEGNKRVKWINREPYAYWKGNPAVAFGRKDLLRCNVSAGRDWNARLYAQNWLSESQKGFKESNLGSQCIHRYKIYIEGSAWSVSEKYILGCDSPALVVSPRYYDFFTRGLMPVQHYWPIRAQDKCRSIKFAVDWGNSHKRKAQEIGRAGSDFIHENLEMSHVYDYMFHLLSEYAKLLRYRPTRPPKAHGLCAESMARQAHGTAKEFMTESMVKSPHGAPPCTLPPPFSGLELNLLLRRKKNSVLQVEKWEQHAANF